jgi:hypothetical protein
MSTLGAHSDAGGDTDDTGVRAAGVPRLPKHKHRASLLVYVPPGDGLPNAPDDLTPAAARRVIAGGIRGQGDRGQGDGAARQDVAPPVLCDLDVNTQTAPPAGTNSKGGGAREGPAT